MRVVAVLLCLVAVAAAAPFGFLQQSQATGGAQATATSGNQQTPFGNSQISQQSASAGGSAQGNAQSTNQASSSQQSSSGIFGQQSSSNTNAVSNQQSGIGYPVQYPGAYG